MKVFFWRWDLSRDEKRNVAGAFLTLGGFMAGHALLETARDSLFLSRLPASELPWVYLAIALISLLLTRYHRRLVVLFAARNELSLWLSASGLVTLLFWLMVGRVGPWVYYALYVWSGVLVTLVGVRFWTLLGGLFNLTRAKHVFALIGTGSVVGAILGSFVAVVLATYLPARHLLLASAGLLLLSAPLPRIMHLNSPVMDPPEEGSQEELRAVLRKVWAGPYLRRLGLLILLSTVTFTLVDFLFKSAADRFVPAAQLDQFFSSVYLALNLSSLLVQLIVAPRLLPRLGVHASQGVVPGLLLMGCAGFWAAGGLLAALSLKAVDGSLRHSFHRTLTELLFVPLPEKVRGQVKGVIDVLGQRGGQSLASLLILGALRVGADEQTFLAFTLASALLWLLLVPGVKQHYLGVFREILTSEVSQARIDFPALDTASLTRLLQALNHPDDRRVLAALEMLHELRQESRIPALILYHPAPRVVLRALELLGVDPKEDVLPAIERLVEHEHEAIRAAAVQALVMREGGGSQAVLDRARRDASPAVRATALVGIIARDGLPSARQLREVERQGFLNSSPAIGAMARAIRARPLREFGPLLALMCRSQLGGSAPLELVRAMRAVGTAQLFEPLLMFLGTRRLRGPVTEALLALRPAVVSQLDSALRNPEVPHGIRCHVPAVVRRFEPTVAAEILIEHLQGESDGMIRFKILRALGALRKDYPRLELPAEPLQLVLDENLGSAVAYSQWRRQLGSIPPDLHLRAGSVHDILADLLRHKQIHALERIFRLLNLLYASEDFRKVYAGLRSEQESSRAGSRELLEYLVPKTLAGALLELFDDSTLRDGVASSEEYGEVLEVLLESPSEMLSCLAARQLAHLEIPGWERLLRRRLRGASTALALVIQGDLPDSNSRMEGQGAR